MEPAQKPVGFSLGSKKPQRKIEVHDKAEGRRKEAVVGFGADGLQTAEPKQAPEGQKVIAKLENTYRCADRRPTTAADTAAIPGR